jgi:hypothetical protein
MSQVYLMLLNYPWGQLGLPDPVPMLEVHDDNGTAESVAVYKGR